MKCQSCGEPVTDYARAIWIRDWYGIEPDPRELSYCRECADELFRSIVHPSSVDFRVGRPSPCPWHREE